MKLRLFVSTVLLWTFFSCAGPAGFPGKKVSSPDALSQAIAAAQPGDEIVMANGVWKDVRIKFVGYGTERKPITLRAETPGEVRIEGTSDLRIGGEYLVVKGLHFTNGAAPKRSVIQFYLNNDTLANHCQVTECVITDFNKAQRNQTDLWVLFKGRHNQLDHCYLAGKSNRGPTVRVDLEGNPSIKNYHQIVHNHFGPRPPKGGPSAETIQVGNSYTSVAPSHTLVAHNLFDQCNGEVEVISSKTNFNEYRNNVFYKSEGSLVARHGNYCIIDGNYFIGDKDNPQIGGVRLIGSGHWVTNNYFYQLKGEVFRSPLAVMNGIPKSPQNRYVQVTDAVVAYNSWIDCTSPLQFGIGSNVDQRDVLPASEIRSERPIRTVVANNLIYNSQGDAAPVVAHDKLDGINFQRNLIQNQGTAFEGPEGIAEATFDLKELAENIYIPGTGLPDTEPYMGFEFEQIAEDLFGASRKPQNALGAVVGSPTVAPDIMNLDQYGPAWFEANPAAQASNTHQAFSAQELMDKVEAAASGDIIEIGAGSYTLTAPLSISKSLTIRAAEGGKVSLVYGGPDATPLFEMNPKGLLTLENLKLQGQGSQYAFAPLKENMSSLYNLTVVGCEISDFAFVLKAYKYSFSEDILFKGTTIRNCANGLELAAEDDDRGDYNAENLTIEECRFEGVLQNVVDYYRGGYDESTVGGYLRVFNSTFTGCGRKEKNGILLNTYGIINVKLEGNTFTNNPVRQVAQLWGAKNNTAQNNVLANSGQIVTEENLKLKVIY
ncbi:MAG: chondroitinase-B domain-containing protein [Bacteroidota bacterium]